MTQHILFQAKRPVVLQFFCGMGVLAGTKDGGLWVMTQHVLFCFRCSDLFFCSSSVAWECKQGPKMVAYELWLSMFCFRRSGLSFFNSSLVWECCQGPKMVAYELWLSIFCLRRCESSFCLQFFCGMSVLPGTKNGGLWVMTQRVLFWTQWSVILHLFRGMRVLPGTKNGGLWVMTQHVLF